MMSIKEDNVFTKIRLEEFCYAQRHILWYLFITNIDQGRWHIPVTMPLSPPTITRAARSNIIDVPINALYRMNTLM
jgi:hypothetical protein